MSHGHGREASTIRAGLSHPVIDADGHWIEYGPHITRRLKEIAGEPAVQGFLHFGQRIIETVALSVEERRERGQAQEAWWVLPTKNTRDRATAMMPNLLRSRLDEFGIDFAVLYPTSGLGLPQVPDETARRASCMAYNTYAAEFFAAHPDRLTPAGVIPMHTPDEAIEAIEHAHDIGLKCLMLGSLMRRSIPALTSRDAELAEEFPWLDVIGLDSPYDYDPVWQRCLDLGFSPTFHSNGRGRAFGLRNSASNFVYNHIGHFAAASEAVCKALFLGGVTHRFPALKFGFLEGGVGWACQLYSDLLGHWEKRRLDALEDIDPANLDEAGLIEFARQFASPEYLDLMEARAPKDPPKRPHIAPAEGLDDFSACGLHEASDLVGQFTTSFYFGCEADDPMNAWAFKPAHLPHGATINTLFGSDIGHFDVPEMAGVLPEAHELVDDGLISTDDFRRFVFENPVRFLSEANRDFFAGTVVEKAVSDFWSAAA